MMIGAKRDINVNVEDSHLPGHGLHSVDGPHEIGMTDLPFGVKSKADLVESIPLFLSEQYKQIYLASAQSQNQYGSGVTSPNSSKAPVKKDEKKEVKKGPAKMYRSAWILEKLNQQIDKKKKSRGQKSKTETAAPSSAPATGGKKGKGKGGAGTVDTFELEQIIEELQNEIKIKDSEF